MRVLLIEDDPMIGRNLAIGLREAGMTVDWFQDGIQGLSAAEAGHHAVILLDLGLPRKSGIDVLKTLRSRGKDTPLLIITARDELDDKVAGLDLGADDYLVKPFSFKELIARMRAILRRQAGHATSNFGNSEITLDLSSRTATYRGKTLSLSAKEFALLYTLVSHPGTIFSRTQIEEHIYGWGEEVESNVVDVIIHYLRRKFDNEIIRNVRGVGWMVVK